MNSTGALMAITSLIVANLTTTSAYAASFVVEVYSDSGLTTLVGSDSCAAVSGSGGGFVQSTALVVHGLTYGATYYARAGVVAPVTSIVTWSSKDTIVMGTNTVPSGTAYTATLTPTINGINVSSVVTSPPSDLSFFEAYWSTVAGTPATGQVASWTGNQDGAGHLVFFAGTTSSTTLYIYVRAVNTTGQKQTWTSLGSATSLAASPSSGANLVYATPDGTSGAATLRALVAADIPSLPESKVTNLVTDLAAKVPTTRTVNGHALSSNVVVTVSDLAIPGNVGVRLDPIIVGKTMTQQMAYAGSIVSGMMYADVSGSAQITVSKTTPTTYPTFTSIVASAPAKLVSQQKNTSVPLTGWTLTFAKDDILQFALDSATTVAWVVLNLDTVRS
jgi:hypothetical protein